MIIASGNVVHNLRRVRWSRPDAAFDWAVRFEDAVAGVLDGSPEDILRTTEHPDFELAAPTPDHFIPLLYFAGLAAVEARAEALVRGGADQTSV